MYIRDATNTAIAVFGGSGGNPAFNDGQWHTVVITGASGGGSIGVYIDGGFGTGVSGSFGFDLNLVTQITLLGDNVRRAYGMLA